MKKRFKSEAEIVELIDQYRHDIAETNGVIDDLEQLITALRTTCEAYRIMGLRQDIERHTRQVAWREGRLETLKQALAEFLTAPIPGVIDGDTSVAAA